MQGQTERRKAEFQKIEENYQKTIAKNPYTEAERKKGFAIANQFGKGNKREFNRDFNAQQGRYNAQAQQAKIEAEKKLRYKHYTADGYNVNQQIPPNAGKDAFRAVQKYKNYDPRKTYHNKNDVGFNQGWARAEVARQWLLQGKLNMNEYENILGSSVSFARQQREAQAERAKAKSRAKLAGEVIQDKEKWNNIANSFTETKAQNDADFFNDVVETVPNYDKMTQKRN